MASTSINTGVPVRWENAGLLRIYDSGGTNDYKPLFIKPGSLRYEAGHIENIPIMDRGVYTEVKQGDERPSKISFVVEPTPQGLSGTNDLFDTLKLTVGSSGQTTRFKVVVDIPTYRGASTGVTVTFNDCYLAAGEKFRAGTGKAVDELEWELESIDADPTYATY